MWNDLTNMLSWTPGAYNDTFYIFEAFEGSPDVLLATVTSSPWNASFSTGLHKLYIIAGTDSLVTDNPRYLNSNPSSIIGFGTFPTPDVERNGRTLNWQEIEGCSAL